MNQHKMEHVLSANPISATESVLCTSNIKDERNFKEGSGKSDRTLALKRRQIKLKTKMSQYGY